MLKVTDVITAVANQYEMPVAVLLDKSMRSPSVTKARHVAQYLSSKLTFYSLKKIGEAFGTDHTGILYGRRRVAHMLLSNREFKAEVDAIKVKLNGKKGSK